MKRILPVILIAVFIGACSFADKESTAPVKVIASAKSAGFEVLAPAELASLKSELPGADSATYEFRIWLEPQLPAEIDDSAPAKPQKAYPYKVTAGLYLCKGAGMSASEIPIYGQPVYMLVQNSKSQAIAKFTDDILRLCHV